MTTALQQIDLWAEGVIASITGAEVMQHDGAFLAKLEPLTDPADACRRAARLDRALRRYRFELRKPYNIALPDGWSDATEVCQLWHTWGPYIPTYLADESGDWRLRQLETQPDTILTGYDPLRVAFNLQRVEGGPIPVLQRRDGSQWATWMSVSDMEVGTMSDQVLEARGDVLVGGLGMALYPALLEVNERVKSVTVVERDDNIIRMMEPYTDLLGVDVVNDDLFRYATTNAARRRFDYVYVDIWQTIAESYIDEEKVKELLEPVVRSGGRIAVWCQRFNRRCRSLARSLESIPANFVPDFTFDPCFSCGESPRSDFHGACMNCCAKLMA